jgi:serine/threonine protein kinase
MLKNRDVLKGHVYQAYQAAGGSGAGGAGEANGLDKQHFRIFVAKLAECVGVSPKVFSGPDDQHLRFDSSGTGLLQPDELYKFAFFNLAKYWRTAATSGAINVSSGIPRKSPSAAGYRVTKDLGSGAQGGAKLAIGPTGQEVCMKVITKMSAQQVGMAQLQDEYLCQRLTAADHVLKMQEIFQDDQHFYMISEPYHGGDLTTLAKKAKQQGVNLNGTWWKNIFRQGLSALFHLHGHAMMHCDIKEPNLMVKSLDFKQPHICLIDFGIARAMADDSEETCGTPGYIPPETWDTGKWFPKGDIFSWGVCMVQMMADKLPPLGARTAFSPGGIFLEGCATFPEIQNATKNRQPPFHLMQPQDRAIVTLASKCLSKRMKGRPTSKQGLADPGLAN